MDELFSELQAGGERDSSGRFTLDLLKAFSKLSAHQLASPIGALLKFVQHGLASGARRVDLHLRAREVVLSHDGRGLDQTDRAALGGLSSSEPRLHHLGVALRALAVTEPPVLELETEPRVRLRYTRGTEPALPFSLRDLDLAVMARHGTRVAGEVLLLGQACRYSPVGIFLNGSRIKNGLFGGPRPVDNQGFNLQVARCRIVDSRVPECDGVVASYPPVETDLVVTRGESDEPGTVTSVTALRLGVQPVTDLVFVRHGVVVEETQLETGRPGVLVLAAVPQLAADLSEFKLVRDAAFTHAVRGLMEAADDLRDRVLRGEGNKSWMQAFLGPPQYSRRPFLEALEKRWNRSTR